MTATTCWTGTITATSSLAHGGETRGTLSLLRRETVVQPDGRLLQVPIISGNTLRGRLRRVGEELLRDALGYEGQVPLPVAHALRGGGALAKTGKEPLSGARLAHVRRWLPLVAVFGVAAGGRIADGGLWVGKVVPQLAEVAHLYGADWTMTAFRATQLETYTRTADLDRHDFAPVVVPLDEEGRPLAAGGEQDNDQLVYRVETWPAGTTFRADLTLHRGTDLETAFLADVLDHWAKDGRLGGRTSMGLGRVAVDLTPDRPVPAVDWRHELASHPDEVAEALELLR